MTIESDAETTDQRDYASRDALIHELAEFSEDAHFTTWHDTVEFEAWGLLDGRVREPMPIHATPEWQLEVFREFRDTLGVWPSGDVPENPTWHPVAVFERMFVDWKESERLRLENRNAALRAEPVTERDLEILALIVEKKPCGVEGPGVVSRLRAHGLLRSTGWTIFDNEITDEGAEALAAREASPRL